MYQEQNDYLFSLGHWATEAGKALLSNIHLKKGQTYLDVGCGVGTLTELFSHTIQIDGLDNQRQNIEFAQKRFPNRHFYFGDALRLPFSPKTYDGYLSALTYSYLSDPEEALREAVRVTKSGGIIALSIWDLPSGFPYFPVFETLQNLNILPNHPILPLNLDDLIRMAKKINLDKIEGKRIEIRQKYANFQEYWEQVLKLPTTNYFSENDLKALQKALKKRFADEFEITARLFIMTAQKSFS